MEANSKKLTSFSASSGCGCKMEPQVLHQILNQLAKTHHEGLICGHEHADDAAVFDLGNGNLLLLTTDFFTPVVDDPFVFGQVAAANALSDIWVMGGTPLMANAILGWPIKDLGTESAIEVMKGAAEICAKSGVALAGGHSIDIQVPVFGLSVNGTVSAQHLMTNADALEGDHIYLSDRLGVGIMLAAYRKKLLPESTLAELFEQLTGLNQAGPQLAALTGVHALTDVTGFGLLGHLLEVCKASQLSAVLQSSQIPILEESRKYAANFVMPDNTFRNWNAIEAWVEPLKPELFAFLNDPQTNGPMLIFAKPDVQSEMQEILHSCGADLYEIGQMIKESEIRIHWSE